MMLAVYRLCILKMTVYRVCREQAKVQKKKSQKIRKDIGLLIMISNRTTTTSCNPIASTRKKK